MYRRSVTHLRKFPSSIEKDTSRDPTPEPDNESQERDDPDMEVPRTQAMKRMQVDKQSDESRDEQEPALKRPL